MTVKESEKINIGLGFATGRKSFQKVLRTYLYNWRESGIPENDGYRINLIVAYDTEYSKTKPADYTDLRGDFTEIINKAYFIGKPEVQREIGFLSSSGMISKKEAEQFFSGGYAGQRNAIIYFALKNKIDYLIFLDDDEYPIAVTKTRSTALWSGQHVINTHMEFIQDADITHGHHCGYISPIPYIEFNKDLPENDFRLFIEAISNDIVGWDALKSVMKQGGASYADTNVLIQSTAQEVPEINNAKFISGGNLCINLTCPERVNAFYNPPGARGEDTFLSTTLSDRKVMKVPCYTFHDGFGTYKHLLDGVLPLQLSFIKAENEQIANRFYRACIGWVRYKPLLLYITQRDRYENSIREMRLKLSSVLPKLCAFFGRQDFSSILAELDRYDRNVKKHYAQYKDMQRIWADIKNLITDQVEETAV